MNDEGKVATTFSIEAETAERIDRLVADSVFRNQSEFAEEALKFYMGFLGGEDKSNYISQMLETILEEKFTRTFNRFNSLVFKLAVEMNMMAHIIGSNIGYNQQGLDALRARCEQEVKDTHGRIFLDKAVKYEQTIRNSLEE